MFTAYKTGDVVFGNWVLGKGLGEGSFGRVFEAEREDFGTVYKSAIKIISVPQSQSEIASVRSEGLDEATTTDYFYSLVKDMVSEFSLMAKLKGNSSIVSYEDHAVIQHKDTIGWDILIRMELLTPLVSYLEGYSMPRQEVIRLGIDMCNALELCRKYDIIHRDIKPENIFVSDTGNFKLGDFGIARTIENTVGALSKKGTYSYMAPEVYKEEPYNSSVDIYSLGIVLYSLLNNNRTPFLPVDGQIKRSDRELALKKRFSGEEIPCPEHDNGRLAEIVLKACSYDAQDRYSSPEQMRSELESLLNEQNGGDSEFEETIRKSPPTPVIEPSDEPQNINGFDHTVVKEKDSSTSSALSTSSDSPPPGNKKPWLILTVIAAALLAVFLVIKAFSPDSSEVTRDTPTPTAEILPGTSTPTTPPTTPPTTAPTTPPTTAPTTPPTTAPVTPPAPAAASSGFTSLSVGDIVSFGLFEQDNNTADGREPIQWVVLAVEKDRALIITSEGLTNQQFNKDKQNNWEKSSLRDWLNFSFLNLAFSSQERKCVLEAPSGDKIFALSQEEFELYCTSNALKQCKATAYAKRSGTATDASGNCWYWLRSQGENSRNIAAIKSDGTITSDGLSPTSTDTAVRPALWLGIN